MSASIQRLRIATYNVHKCRGLDQRRSPERIAKVLAEVDADIVALQEVVNDPTEASRKPEREQAQYLASALGMKHYRFEPAHNWRKKPYGNAVLSRFPIEASHNYDISWKRQEPRACMRVDLSINGHQRVHLFNVHLGTSPFERVAQAKVLVSSKIVNNTELTEPRILLGDFNDWMQGLPSRLLAEHLVSADVRLHLQHCRTYPGFLPFVHLDHIYFEESFQLDCLTLHRTRTALIASDHLPLVAELSLPSRLSDSDQQEGATDENNGQRENPGARNFGA